MGEGLLLMTQPAITGKGALHNKTVEVGRVKDGMKAAFQDGHCATVTPAIKLPKSKMRGEANDCVVETRSTGIRFWALEVIKQQQLAAMKRRR